MKRLFKLLVVLIFVFPFAYAPVKEIQNTARKQRLTRYQPLQENQVSGHRKFNFVDLSKCTNADYHHNAFFPDAKNGSDHFPDLTAGIYRFGKIIFSVPEPYSVRGRPSVITTGENPYFSCPLSLAPVPSRAVHLAIDGAWIDDQISRIAHLEVHYQDGKPTPKILRSNVDVWSYHAEGKSQKLPRNALLWEGVSGQKIVVVSLPLDPRRIPIFFEISTMPAVGKERRQPAVTIFAVTQEFLKERKD